MHAGALLERGRHNAGLSQSELAKRAHTSSSTISAYENGRKSPTLETAVRLLNEAGYDLALVPRISFIECSLGRGRPIYVPTRLPQLEPQQAFALVTLPLHLNWSSPGQKFDLRNRRKRARVYEIVLREGMPLDICTYIDGNLLIDLWEDLIVPSPLRAAWAPLIKGTKTKHAK